MGGGSASRQSAGVRTRPATQELPWPICHRGCVGRRRRNPVTCRNAPGKRAQRECAPAIFRGADKARNTGITLIKQGGSGLWFLHQLYSQPCRLFAGRFAALSCAWAFIVPAICRGFSFAKEYAGQPFEAFQAIARRKHAVFPRIGFICRRNIRPAQFTAERGRSKLQRRRQGELASPSRSRRCFRVSDARKPGGACKAFGGFRRINNALPDGACKDGCRQYGRPDKGQRAFPAFRRASKWSWKGIFRSLAKKQKNFAQWLLRKT